MTAILPFIIELPNLVFIKTSIRVKYNKAKWNFHQPSSLPLLLPKRTKRRSHHDTHCNDWTDWTNSLKRSWSTISIGSQVRHHGSTNSTKIPIEWEETLKEATNDVDTMMKPNYHMVDQKVIPALYQYLLVLVRFQINNIYFRTKTSWFGLTWWTSPSNWSIQQSWSKDWCQTNYHWIQKMGWTISWKLFWSTKLCLPNQQNEQMEQ